MYNLYCDIYSIFVFRYDFFIKTFKVFEVQNYKLLKIYFKKSISIVYHLWNAKMLLLKYLINYFGDSGFVSKVA